VPSPARHRRLRWAALPVAAALAVVTAACGGAATPATPPITVAATLYPLAQVAAALGGPAVHVIDLTAPGKDPRTLAATPARVAALRTAAVDVEVGGGFQPALEQAAVAPQVASLSPRFGPPEDGPWLDPGTMEAALPVISAALTAADPAARSRFANGERDLYEQLASVSSAYQDATSACDHDQIAAPGPTLADLARRYRLRLRQLSTDPDPSPAAVAADGRAVTASGARSVLTLPWVPDAAARAVARQASVGTRAFDTAEAPPAGGWPKGTTYIGLLDKGQGTILGALGCPSSTD
jgi:zinc transport system substrate-binding protein